MEDAKGKFGLRNKDVYLVNGNMRVKEWLPHCAVAFGADN